MDKATARLALVIAVIASIVAVLAMNDDGLRGDGAPSIAPTAVYTPLVATYPDCLDMGYPCVDRPETGVSTLHFDDQVFVVTVVSSSPDPDGVLWHTIQR